MQINFTSNTFSIKHLRTSHRALIHTQNSGKWFALRLEIPQSEFTFTAVPDAFPHSRPVTSWGCADSWPFLCHEFYTPHATSFLFLLGAKAFFSLNFLDFLILKECSSILFIIGAFGLLLNSTHSLVFPWGHAFWSIIEMQETVINYLQAPSSFNLMWKPFTFGKQGE